MRYVTVVWAVDEGTALSDDEVWALADRVVAEAIPEPNVLTHDSIAVNTVDVDERDEL